VKNFVQRGDNVSFLNSQLIAPQALAKSGDPVVVGRLCGVANGDALSATDTVVITTRGVFNLLVSTIHNGLSLGETVFIDPVTALLTDDFADVPFGVALGTVPVGTPTTIPIRLFGATPGAIGFGS